MASGRTRQTRRTAPQSPPHTPETWIAAILVAAGLLAYLNSFTGAFVFDDSITILKNEQIRSLWPIWKWLGAERPIVSLSLALNYQIGQYHPWGYHLFNLMVHLLAGLTLFGVVRRTLSVIHQERGSPSNASWIAGAAALLWLLHPLQTQSVTYIIQRSESMMGLFYLLTLYCLIRGSDSSRASTWYAAAIASCALGMGCKAVMVTAPVIMAIYDRMFLSKSWRDMLRSRWALYVGLAVAWQLLVFSGVVGGVFHFSPRADSTVGFSVRDIDPLSYARTQPGVILHYLRLAFWPIGQCLDYSWPIVRQNREALLPSLILLILLAGSVWALCKKRWLGFAGAWFFIILSPTSSFIPIKDAAFEQRMYLPLAAVIVVAMAGIKSVLDWLFTLISLRWNWRRRVTAALVMVAAIALGTATRRRNALFADPVLIWQDTLRHAPDNPRAHNTLGWVYLQRGENDKAKRKFRDAIAVDPDFSAAYVNMGTVLLRNRDSRAAIDAFRQALKINPQRFGPDVYEKLATAYLFEKEYGAAIDAYRQAIRRFPGECSQAVYLNLGHALMMENQLDEAIEAFRTALRLNPRYVLGYFDLGNALSQNGDLAGAIGAYRNALRINPRYAEANVRLGVALERTRHSQEAIKCYRNALNSISPQTAGWVRAEANYQSGRSLMSLGRSSEAMTFFRAALKADPNHVDARRTLQELTGEK